MSGIDEGLDAPLGSSIGGSPIPPPPSIPGGGINEGLDAPLSGGGTAIGSNDDVPWLWDIAIGGHTYMIDETNYDRQTLPLKREPTDQSVEPGEQSLATNGAWRRSQSNWFLGAGQKYLDNEFAYVSVYTHSGEDPSVRTRFWRSKGVNPWEEGALSLLPECNRKAAFTGTGIVMAVGPHLYLWDGAKLAFTDTPADRSPTWTPVTAPAGSGDWPDVKMMATDGTNLYLALGVNGIASTTGGTSLSAFLRPAVGVPTVTPLGATAATDYTYFIVGTDVNGFKTLVSAGVTIHDGPVTLTPTDANEITWAPVNGIVRYDVLKDDTAHSLATGITGTSYTDDGSVTTSPYTAPTVSTDNFQPTFVSYGNGFLIAGAGALLAEVDANGATVLVMRHRNPGWHWDAGCGSPMAIYVTGSAGNVCEVYGIQISSTTFGLDAPYIAGQVTRGEIVRSLCYYEGLVIMTTNLGVRASQDSGNSGHLNSGPVVTGPGDSKCCVPWGAFVWFGWDNFDMNDGVYPHAGTATGLGRISLNEFSAPLTPAFATDVMAEDNVLGEVTSCEVVDGGLYFTVAGNGMWGPSGNAVPYGYLETGYVRYGTIENKTLTSVDVRCEPLKGEVQLEVVPGGLKQSATLATLTDQGVTGPSTPWTGGLKTGDQFMVITTLRRDANDLTTGPTLRRWTIRAIVTAGRQDQIVVPIRWKEQLDSAIGDGSKLSMNLRDEWAFLKGLEQSGEVVPVQVGNLIDMAYIDEIENKGAKWPDSRDMPAGVLNVKLITVTA